MSQSFIPIVTIAGRAADQASKLAGGAPVRFASMVIGDGNGAPVSPLETQGALVNQMAVLPVTSVTVNPLDATQIVVEAKTTPLMPRGYVVREVGVVLDTGVLYAVASYPDTNLPLPGQGAVVDLDIKVPFFETLANGAVVIFNNPGQFATEQWVIDNTSPSLALLLRGIALLTGKVLRLVDFARHHHLRIAKAEREVASLRAQMERVNFVLGLTVPPLPAPPKIPFTVPPFSAVQPDTATDAGGL